MFHLSSLYVITKVYVILIQVTFLAYVICHSRVAIVFINVQIPWRQSFLTEEVSYITNVNASILC